MPNANAHPSPALVLAALLAALAIVLALVSRPCGRTEGYQLVPPGAKQAERRANRILNGYMDV